jgi:hypothetical protein
MALFTRKRAASVAFVFLLLLSGRYFLVAGLPFAHLRGTLAAKRDVSRGHYRILTYGLAISDRGEYARILHDHYGVDMQVVAGCVVDSSLVDYAAGYNDVMKAALQQRYKHDVLAEAWSETEMDMKQARLKDGR